MPITYPKNRKWVAYNHMPGGQIVVQHFDDSHRERRLGDDKTEQVSVTAAEQIRGFEKSDFVAINISGVITKHKVIVYGGPQIAEGDPKQNDKVAEWAMAQGLRPIQMASEKAAGIQTAQQATQIRDLESRVSGLEEKLDKSDEKIDKILDAVSASKK